MSFKIYFQLFLLLFVSSSHLLAGGEFEIDSLLQRSVTAHDTEKVSLYNSISNIYTWEVGAPDSAMHYCMKSFMLAKKINDKAGMLNALLLKGIIHRESGQLALARNIFDQVLSVAKEVNAQSKRTEEFLISIYYNYAVSLEMEMNFSRSTEYFLTVLRLSEPLMEDRKNKPEGSKLLKEIRSTYTHLSQIFVRIEDYVKAIDYLKRGLKIADELKADEFSLELMNNIAGIYFKTGQYDSSRYYYTKTGKTALGIGHASFLITANDGIARTYSAQNNFEASLKYYDTLENIIIAMENEYLYALVNYQRGWVYVKMDSVDKALEYFHDALARWRNSGGTVYNIANCNWYIGKMLLKKGKKDGLLLMEDNLPLIEAAVDLEEKPQYYKELSDAYEQTGNTTKAFLFYKNFKALSDSVAGLKNAKSIAELHKRFEEEKKDKEIALLEQDKKIQEGEIEKQRTVRNIVIAGLFVVLILGYFVVRSNAQRKKTNKLLAQQKAVVEEKQKEILDSIYYARRIQRSLLGNEAVIHKNLMRMKKRG